MKNYLYPVVLITTLLNSAAYSTDSSSKSFQEPNEGENSSFSQKRITLKFSASESSPEVEEFLMTAHNMGAHVHSYPHLKNDLMKEIFTIKEKEKDLLNLLRFQVKEGPQISGEERFFRDTFEYIKIMDFYAHEEITLKTQLEMVKRLESNMIPLLENLFQMETEMPKDKSLMTFSKKVDVWRQDLLQAFKTLNISNPRERAKFYKPSFETHFDLYEGNALVDLESVKNETNTLLEYFEKLSLGILSSDSPSKTLEEQSVDSTEMWANFYQSFRNVYHTFKKEKDIVLPGKIPTEESKFQEEMSGIRINTSYDFK